MPVYKSTINKQVFTFSSLGDLLAKASPQRSGDQLAGVAARSETERVAAQTCLADIPLADFAKLPLIPYEDDEVTRLIFDRWDQNAFKPIAHLTVGEFREYLLAQPSGSLELTSLAPGLIPEMVAAVTKMMRNQDLISVAKKLEVTTKFRSTVGLRGTLGVRLQPNHPTDDLKGIAASLIDGLFYGAGDAVIGINPATDSLNKLCELTGFLDRTIQTLAIPTQGCVLGHITTQIKAIAQGAPVDLVFQSIAGTEAANRSFGINLALLKEGRDAALSLGRGGNEVMYFETGQGSCLSANAHSNLDQQTLEARAYAVAREFSPFLVNTVVGFIGPEYLFDGKQIIRAGLEDHFSGKLLGLPMGCDVCYTNHAQADQDDMDTLLTLLAASGCNYVMGVPGADDIMLAYQSTSFHDAHYARETLGLKPAPEFEGWLKKVGVYDPNGKLTSGERAHQNLAPTWRKLLSGK